MIERTRVYVGVSLILLSITLILHIVAISQDHWKIYEHRTNSNNTLSIGIFRRCEVRSAATSVFTSDISPHFLCDGNKYCFLGNPKCLGPGINANEPNMQRLCNLNHNPHNCDFSPVTKGLISCTIIAACFLGISLLFIFSHIFINQHKYKIHLHITIITLPLLFLGFLFLLTALILFGSTIANDLYQYRYNLDYRLNGTTAALKENYTRDIKNKAAEEYDVRLDWAGGLEVCALILSAFTLAVQNIYLISIHRSRTG